MDTTHSLLRSAKQFFAGTLFSRFSGLLRDIAMAFSFGVAPEVAAFMVAYRLANLLRRLFGEGNLQSGFAPHFELLKGESLKNAFVFYRDLKFSFFVTLLALVFAVEFSLWGFLGKVSAEWREILYLTMLMVPALPFICLSSLNSSLLQCQKKYFAPAFAPVLFNIVWIVFALLSQGFLLPKAVQVLSIGITLGFIIQWGATAILVGKELKGHLGWAEWLQPRFFSLDTKQVVLPMALGLIGAGASQINSALDAIFARMADLSGPTFLWYAIRVQQLPLALFGIAIAQALLPPLSRAMREGNHAHYRFLLTGALRQAVSLMVPCTFGIFTLGASGLNLLYGRGHFTSTDIQGTLTCLWGYGIGLVPMSFVLLLAAGSYAKKSFGLPTMASLFSVALNIFLNAILVFVFDLGAVSIALATSASAWLNCALLLRKESLEPGFWTFVAKVTFAGGLASFLSLVFGQWLGDRAFSRNLLDQIVQFAGMGSIFLGSFLLGAKTLRLHEIFMLLQRSAKS